MTIPTALRPLPNNSPVVTDSSLLRYVRDGQEAAAQELYERYASRLRKIVQQRYNRSFSSRFDPEDVVQSVFRVFYQRVHANHYEVPKTGEIWSLLFVIAVNKLHHQIAHHKAAKRNVLKTTAVERGDELSELCDDSQSSLMLRMVVDEYLAGLKDDERAILGLRMTGHTVAEISEKTGRALRSVERILQKNRDELTALIQSC
jgi:RNA polymerase sigma-70 factor, ECF subfamily